MITDPPGYIVEHLQFHLLQGYRLDEGKGYSCPVCGCHDCTLFTPQEPKKYPYLQETWMCESCIRVATTKKLLNLLHGPLEELPLWIGHPWLTDLAYESFRNIVSDRLGPEALSGDSK